MEESAVGNPLVLTMYFRRDAPNRAGTTPTAISPLSLRPRFHRKMAFEQRAIFPMLTG